MMRFAGRAVRLATLCMITCLFLAVTAFAEEGQLAFDTGTTTGAGLRLRSEPSTEAGIVTTLDEGWVVAVLDDSIEGWFQVAYDGNTGYVSADFLSVNSSNSFKSYGRVTADSVNLRSEPNTDGGVVASMSAGDVVTATSLADGWYAVTTTYGSQGYIRSDFLDLTNSASSGSASSSGGNSGIVSTAKQYLGTRYSYGGASPSGFDCSGFTSYVYKHFGVSLSHSSQAQYGQVNKVSRGELQAGDLVFFATGGKSIGHVGIYVGGGQFIHSPSAGRSVCIESMSSGYYASRYVGGGRVR